jgi:hypothetical protein
MKIVSIKKAMQYVTNHPEMQDDDLISLPVHELIVRTLFEIANSPKADDGKSMKQANIARDMIFNRMVGRRRAGSHPATGQQIEIRFEDLTGGELTSE